MNFSPSETSPPQVHYDVSLRAFNTFGIEAKAHAYLQICSVVDLQILYREILPQQPQLAALPQFVLGAGSNIVLRGDFPGLVLHMCGSGMQVVGEDDDQVYIKAQAGQNWHELVLWTIAQGYGGLENLALIPSTVGAAPIQNMGAYGVELQDRFHSLTLFDPSSGQVRVMHKDDCHFGYRDSVFKHAWRHGLIVDVTLALPKNWQPVLSYADVARHFADTTVPLTPQMVCDAVISIRQRKLPDPAKIGNAGSFFKNPVVSASQRDALLATFPQLVSYAQADGSYKLAAGWLIEQAGWKGRQLERVGVHAQQALVLINLGGATGPDVLALAQQVAQDVWHKFGVQLQPEPLYI